MLQIGLLFTVYHLICLHVNLFDATSDDIWNNYSTVAVIAGDPVELFCGTGLKKNIQWWFRSSENSTLGWQMFYNGIDFENLSTLNSNWTINPSRKYSLFRRQTDSNNVGFYKCQMMSVDNETTITRPAIIYRLIVSECALNSDVLRNFDFVEVRCNVSYGGGSPALITWKHATNGKIKNVSAEAFTENISICSISSNCSNLSTNVSTVSPVLRLAVNSSFHNSQILFEIYFNVPNYRPTYIWTSPTLNVTYGPQDIRINPWKEIYYPGDRISCSASANPNPTFEWIDLDTNEIHRSSEIHITKEMLREEEQYNFQCRATNEEDRVGKTANITFSVKGGFPFLIGLVIAMATLSTIFVVVILVVIRKRTKEWISKIANLFRKQEARNEHQPGSVVIANVGALGGHGAFELEYNLRRPIIRPNVSEYLEMQPEVPTFYNNTINESQAKSSNGRQSQSLSRYVGQDGTQYMEMNGFKQMSTKSNPPVVQPPMFDRVIYARIDHTLKAPRPPSKKY